MRRPRRRPDPAHAKGCIQRHSNRVTLKLVASLTAWAKSALSVEGFDPALQLGHLPKCRAISVKGKLCACCVVGISKSASQRCEY